MVQKSIWVLLKNEAFLIKNKLPSLGCYLPSAYFLFRFYRKSHTHTEEIKKIYDEMEIQIQTEKLRQKQQVCPSLVLMPLLICPLPSTDLFMYPFIHSPIHSSFSFTLSFIHSLIHLSTHSFFYPFIHPISSRYVDH